MCNKNSIPTKTKSVTMKKKKKQINKDSISTSSSSSSSSSLKPYRRRNRTKTRKPKFLSLRLQLSQTQNNKPKKTTKQQQEPQLNHLFPLHSETDMQEENNVALLFTSDDGATLNGLLEDESTTLTAATSGEESLSVMRCPAMEGLVRKAMRKRSDEGSEERWVSYSEVVEEKKEMMEEVNSCIGIETTSFGSLSLKLDHDGILNAWSDKGPLYVDAGDEAPQTVPDLFNASSFPPNNAWDGCGCDVGNTWKVPESCGANDIKVKEEMGWKLGQREASLLRYKEKRQSRLFAKRIRYEVRKLNAEKRPRMKGRFVKRE